MIEYIGGMSFCTPGGYHYHTRGCLFHWRDTMMGVCVCVGGGGGGGGGGWGIS